MNKCINYLRKQEKELEPCTLKFNLLLTIVLLEIASSKIVEAKKSFVTAMELFPFVHGFSIEYGVSMLLLIAEYFNELDGSFNTLIQQLRAILMKVLHEIVIEDKMINFSNDTLNGHLSLLRCLIKEESIAYYHEKVLEKFELGLKKFWVYPEQIEQSEKKFFPRGYLDLGVAHGLSGNLLYFSDYTKEYGKDERTQKIVIKIYDILNENIYIDSSKRVVIPGSLQEEIISNEVKTEYLSWCYGTLSIANILNQSIRENYDLKIERIIDSVVHSFSNQNDVTINKIDSYCYCHGYAGLKCIIDSLVSKNVCLKQKKIILEKIAQFDSFTDEQYNTESLSYIDGIPSYYIAKEIESMSNDKKSLFRKLLLF